MTPGARILIMLSATVIGLPLWSHADSAAEAHINSPFFQRLEKKFVCVDGCGMALEDCSNSTAQQMRSDLLQMIDEGESEATISSFMVSIYGLEVLREPPKEGFNLLAWILPFASLVFGGVFVFMVVNRWVFARNVRAVESVDSVPLLEDDIFDELIDDERRKLL